MQALRCTIIQFTVSILDKVNLFVDHSQVMDLECLRGRNLGKDHASVLGSSYFLF
ncbi:hypothetical protein CDL12_13114 [Handroanthus impetiginosus]|uniref:Uncharacterized protein n=1 Tax=Handroanthus impetiginosus TaxID=429701 RepID=A0A2G9H9R0_9LAMI|nr:hypothetical protein CDL12_13114 [Handroanthus impetiginosus]